MQWDKHQLNQTEKIFFEHYRNNDIDNILESFSKTQKDLYAQIDAIRKLVIHAKANNWEDIVIIWNAIGYIAMLSLDLKTYTKILLKQEMSYDKIAILRVLILNMFEGINDIHDVTGKNFSRVLLELNIDHIIIEELKEERKKFVAFKDLYYRDLKKYRDTAAAHRDFDLTKYTEFILETEETSVMKILFEFDALLNDFGIVMTKIMKESATKKVENIKNKNA